MKQKKMLKIKRLIALVLSLIIVFGIVPSNMLETKATTGEESETQQGTEGEGSEEEGTEGEKVNVTITINGGDATVSIAGNATNSNSVAVDKNTNSVPYKIEPAANTYISSIKVNGSDVEETLPAKGSEFNGTVDVGEENVEIVVELGRFVALEYDSQEGRFEPQPTDGKIEADCGTINVTVDESITIEATANAGFEVGKLIINDSESDWDSDYKKELDGNEDLSIEVIFDVIKYTITTESTDHGSVDVGEDATVVHGEVHEVKITPDEGWTIDKIIINEEPVENPAENLNVTNEGIVYEISDITKDTSVKVTFKEKAKAEKNYLSVYTDDSNIWKKPEENGNWIYVFGKKPENGNDESSIILGWNEQNTSNQNIIIKGIKIHSVEKIEGEIKVSEQEKSEPVEIKETTWITKVELKYQAAGELYEDWHTVDLPEFESTYLNRNLVMNVVKDKSAPSVTVSLKPEKNTNYYYDDVKISVKATDGPGFCSGVQTIKYRVLPSEEWNTVYSTVQRGNREEVNIPEPIMVNNTNETVNIEISVTDFAGYETKEPVAISFNNIDIITAFTGDKDPNAEGEFYKTGEFFVIEVSDRNFDNKETFSFTINGVEKAFEWDGENPKIGKYKITEEGTYNWILSYISDGQNHSTSGCIVIDNTAPVVSITGVENYKYYNKPNDVVIEVEDKNFDKDKSAIYVNDKKVDIDSWIEDNGKYQAKIPSSKFTDNGGYEIKVDVRDKAGNITEKITVKDDEDNMSELDNIFFVLDQTAPVLEVTGIENDKYYKDDITVKIELTENTFKFNEDTTRLAWKDLVAIKINDNVYTDYVWTKLSDGKYCAEIVLTVKEQNSNIVEGQNKLSVSVEDFAGNTTEKITVKDNENNTSELDNISFVMDTTLPEIEGISKGKSYWTYVNVEIVGTDENFDKDKSIITIIKKEDDGTEKETTYDGSVWNFKNNKYKASVALDKNGSYIVMVTIKDKAGNSAEKISGEFVVDKNPPVISFDKASGYYNEDQKVKITIKDDTFDGRTESTKVYLNGTEYSVGEWKKTEGNSDEYTAEISLTEGKYNIKVESKDLAGNEESKESGDIVIDKTNPTVTITGVEEGANYNVDKDVVITVTEHNFDPSKVTVYLAENIVYTNVNWSNEEGNVYTAIIPIETDGRYNIEVKLQDKAGNSPDKSSITSTGEFIVDKTEPNNLKVTYLDGTWYEKLFNSLTFGFYKESATVTVSADDTTSGIDKFICYITDRNTKVKTEIADIVYAEDGKSASFTISPEFRGLVSFVAKDKAGNSTDEYIDSTNAVVVDKIAPNVFVTYDNNNVLNDKYYKADRTATIKFTEANVFEHKISDFLKIIVKKTYDNGEEETVEYIPFVEGVTSTGNLVFTPVEGEANTYGAQILFNEDADYVFTIEYSDYSGNGDDYKEIFTIDKTLPEISITGVKEGEFYKTDKTAIVTVTEHNFDKKTVDVYVNEIKLENLKWTPNGNTYVTEVPIDTDDYYIVKVDVTDKAGNPSSAVSGEFVVDKTNPENLSVTYLDGVWYEEFLNNITFGFYQEAVSVTVSAEDATAGIDKFICYVTEEGSKDKIEITDITYAEDRNSASFKIAPQFRGKVSFEVWDKSGNSSSYDDSKNTVVVDDIPPEVMVTYDNNKLYNEKFGNYYNANRTAFINIKEANFFSQDVVITVGKRNNPTDEYVTTVVKPEFKKVDGTDYEYKAEILFDENIEYLLDVQYTDRSGNAFEGYTEEFVIDKILPELTIEGVENNNYYNSDKTVTITVDEHNFYPEGMKIEINAKDYFGNDVTLPDYNEHLTDEKNWTNNGDRWTIEIPLNIEGNYSMNVTCTDKAGNSCEEGVEFFCIDKSIATDLEISYSPVGTWIQEFLENITFGFYQSDITVTIKAKDAYAGIKYFEYSYTVSEDASSINVGKNNVKIDAISVSSDYVASASFIIKPQFRGKVSFKAVDKAGNEVSHIDDKIVVTDNKAPEISVSYDNNNVYNNKYYNADRKATITVKDANFFLRDIGENLIITVGKRNSSKDKYVEEIIKPEFKKQEGMEDVYIAEFIFSDELEYTFDIKYTDRSGNIYDAYEKDEFVIDKTKPVIEVSYDNNSSKNENQFKDERTATVVITEHNFDEKYVKLAIEGDKYKVSKWTNDGDTHTLVIEYNGDSHYEFGISCTDLAGNKNNGVDYGESVAPDKFTVDKTAPTDLTIKVNNISVRGNNSIAFDTFYSEAISVFLSANCDISGVESLKYQKVNNISQYSEDGEWLEYDKQNGIVVVPSEKFVIYFRAEDRAGNVTIINSTGIVVDNQRPVGETKAPDIDIIPESANDNGIYNKDVAVKLNVIDPKFVGAEASRYGYYSGLNRITYRIYTKDTEAVEEGVLLDIANNIVNGASYDVDKLVTSWDGNILINSEKFNSNNVIIQVVAIDNAGNERTTETIPGEIKIDITDPVIEISYDNNSTDSESYFDADRVATIILTERNFNEEDVIIRLTNTDGVVPRISSWVKTAGTGNEDDTRWTATLTYSADGDYEFDIEYTDMADLVCSSDEVNYGTSIMPKKFTVDKTKPVVEVSYDNNNSTNNNFYGNDRVATIIITEHNLVPNGIDKDRIEVLMTATDDGNASTVPAVSEWRTEGDRHIATIHFVNDSLYSLDITVKDKAGNEALDFMQQTFYVDKTTPALTIEGVQNNSANNGVVVPVITYSDTNFDTNQVKITLTGANRKEVELDGTYTEIHNGRIFTFNDFANEQEMDDIYTLTATLTDKAGNTSTEEIVFSVNRFGSTYAVDNATQEISGKYVNNAVDIVITETNADELSDMKVTLFKNSETFVLEAGKDYEVERIGGNGQWYHYTYTIYERNFEADGIYRITIESDDKAGNTAKNDLDTKNKEINFAIDNTLPIISIVNLDSNKTYSTDNMTVEMSIEDNIKLSKVIAELDGKEVRTWSDSELEGIVKTGGNFSFDITGDSTDAHTLVVYAVDAAGNGEKIADAELPENVERVERFFVTTNVWVRYYTNKPLFYGSIAGVVVLLGVSTFIIVYRNKKKAAK